MAGGASAGLAALDNCYYWQCIARCIPLYAQVYLAAQDRDCLSGYLYMASIPYVVCLVLSGACDVLACFLCVRCVVHIQQRVGNKASDIFCVGEKQGNTSTLIHALVTP